LKEKNRLEEVHRDFTGASSTVRSRVMRSVTVSIVRRKKREAFPSTFWKVKTTATFYPQSIIFEPRDWLRAKRLTEFRDDSKNIFQRDRWYSRVAHVVILRRSKCTQASFCSTDSDNNNFEGYSFTTKRDSTIIWSQRTENQMTSAQNLWLQEERSIKKKFDPRREARCKGALARACFGVNGVIK